MKISKFNKLVCNLDDENNSVVHIRALKQVLSHGLTLINVHRVIEFNEETWLKGYIDMNTALRTKVKNYFEKKFVTLSDKGCLSFKNTVPPSNLHLTPHPNFCFTAAVMFKPGL